MGTYLLISDAAKEVKVESHVLRYWEEELRLPIKRNELGHRYYTQEDVERFRQIKAMKERGLQLKAIKMILKDGRLDVLPQEDFMERASGENSVEREKALAAAQDTCAQGSLPIDVVAVRDAEADNKESGYREDTDKQFHEPMERRTADMQAESREEKARRLQWLLQQLFRETLRENNEELCRNIKESIIKELDYQFRNQEEREEERDRLAQQRSEEYYQKMDELLRKKSRRRAEKPQKKSDKTPPLSAPKAENKKKRHFVF
ncbi:MAG: helix-turn-helix domain-containing protein [bacterium]|nr:helix-turn-helix domain-containing protein [bacterium]MCM1375277.1 helix-turn-helix domain-containing protein [Muribaculum sp.]MCM1409807.1 helix-turn-helix domain-containing protein [Lachnospiraceae bacterium]